MAQNATGGSGGSSVRDHLANERTYLAWLRTALSVMTLGLAIAKFINTGGDYAIVPGAVLVGVGAAGLIYGTVRYRLINAQLEAGRHITGAGPLVPMFASAVLLAGIVASLALLIVGA